MADEEEDLDVVEDFLPEGASTIVGLKRQLFCCLSSFITMFCAAIAMHREFDILVPAAVANGIPSTISMPFVGDLFGAFLAMPMLHIFGRKVSLMISHVLFILPSVAVVIGLKETVESYLIILIHMALRFFLVVFAVYFAEMSDRWLRGIFISSRYFLYDAGHILASHAFEKSTMGCMLVVLLQMMSMGFSVLISESPYYLALTGQRDEAETQFNWLQGGVGDSDNVLNVMNRAETDAENAATGLPFGLKTFVWPLLVIFCMELGVMGSIPISYYVQTSIEHLHGYRPLIEFDDIVFGANRFVVREEFLFLTMKLLGVFLIAVLPRRVLYLGIVLISMICCTSYMYAGVNSTVIYQVVTAYKFIVVLGGEQLSHVCSTEIFPALVRPFGVSFSQIFQTAIDYVTLYALHVPENIDTFVVVCFALIPLGFIMSFVFMPETFGMTLQEAEDSGGFMVGGMFKNYLVDEEDESVAEE